MATIPPVTKLYVRMTPDELRQLGDDARRERRPAADHAAWLLSGILAERRQRDEGKEHDRER